MSGGARDPAHTRPEGGQQLRRRDPDRPEAPYEHSRPEQRRQALRVVDRMGAAQGRLPLVTVGRAHRRRQGAHAAQRQGGHVLGHGAVVEVAARGDRH